MSYTYEQYKKDFEEGKFEGLAPDQVSAKIYPLMDRENKAHLMDCITNAYIMSMGQDGYAFGIATKDDIDFHVIFSAKGFPMFFILPPHIMNDFVHKYGLKKNVK